MHASCYGTASSKMVWWWWWWGCTTNMAGLVLNAPHSRWFVNFSILTSCQLQRVTFGRITHSKLFYTSAKHKSLTWNRPRVLVHNLHARELISDQKMSQAQQQRPKSPMVTCGVFTLQAQVTYGCLRSFYLAGPSHLWLLAEFLPCRPTSPMVTCGVFTLQAQVTYGYLRSFYLAGPSHLW